VKYKKQQQVKVDPEIMQELLDEPGVREHVEKMTAQELEFYKRLLVRQGIYAQYLKERDHAGL
jgi:hypothetical protein